MTNSRARNNGKFQYWPGYGNINNSSSNNNKKNNKQPTRACKHCGQWGHFDGSCPENQPNGQNQPKNTQKSSQTSDSKICSHCSSSSHEYDNCKYRNYSQEYIIEARDRGMDAFLLPQVPHLPQPICGHCASNKHLESNCSVADLPPEALEVVRKHNQEQREREKKNSSSSTERCWICQASHKVEDCPVHEKFYQGIDSKSDSDFDSTPKDLSIKQAYLQLRPSGVGYQVWDVESNICLPVEQDNNGNWYVWSVFNKEQYKIIRQAQPARLYCHDAKSNTSIELTQQFQVRRNTDGSGFHLFDPASEVVTPVQQGVDGTFFITHEPTQQRYFIQQTADRGWWVHTSTGIREFPVQLYCNF